jgi:formate dehydrogenase maturation protein FdhE
VTFRAGARRGGPGDFAARLERAERLLSGKGGAGAAAPLTLLASVLRFQAGRVSAPAVVAAAGALSAGADLRLAAERFPLLDLPAAVSPIAAEIPLAVAELGTGLPEPLVAGGMALTQAETAEREELVATWLDDPAVPEPVLGFWVRVAGGPILEGARAGIPTPSRDEWTGAACPACGGPAQASVIAEESGEFMGGSPRSLVCGRCAGWWTFPRAMCTWCGEADPRKLPSFVPDERDPGGGRNLRGVRIDGCETCSSYVKTFDLREAGGIELVPLVDDVATVALDLWANDQGLTRHLVSFAGV